MRTDVYRYSQDTSLFMVVPKGTALPVRVRVSGDVEIEAGQWQFSRELDIDANKAYVGLDVQTAIADLQRQGWHLGNSKDTSRV